MLSPHHWPWTLISEGDHVLDIGANQGVYTSFFADLVGRCGLVYAIEPGPKLYQRLTETVGIRPNVLLYSFALSDRNEEREVFHYRDWTLLPYDEADPRCQNKNWNPAQPFGLREERFLATFRTLDSLVRCSLIDSKVSFVKIDVDGAEGAVIRGATEFLAKAKPTLALEVGHESMMRLGDVADLLLRDLLQDELGYVIYNGNPGERLIRMTPEEVVSDIISAPERTMDIVCIHESKVGR